jgi:phosphohistidine phosphatase SixA
MKIIVAAVTALAILLGAPASIPAQGLQASQNVSSIVDVKQLAQLLRRGGYVILVRHGATFSNQADADPFTFSDVTKQRNLNDKGKELAKAFGDAIRAADVPVGKVYTSLFNRAYETAILAGFEGIETTVDLTEGGLVVTPDENARRAEALRGMLAKAPAPKKNDILITHKPNIIDALGKDWFDVKEGEASIFKPDAGKYHLVARLQMADWPNIAVSQR